jgi:hypothetical protein
MGFCRRQSVACHIVVVLPIAVKPDGASESLGNSFGSPCDSRLCDGCAAVEIEKPRRPYIFYNYETRFAATGGNVCW